MLILQMLILHMLVSDADCGDADFYVLMLQMLIFALQLSSSAAIAAAVPLLFAAEMTAHVVIEAPVRPRRRYQAYGPELQHLECGPVSITQTVVRSAIEEQLRKLFVATKSCEMQCCPAAFVLRVNIGAMID